MLSHETLEYLEMMSIVTHIATRLDETLGKTYVEAIVHICYFLTAYTHKPLKTYTKLKANSERRSICSCSV